MDLTKIWKKWASKILTVLTDFLLASVQTRVLLTRFNFGWFKFQIQSNSIIVDSIIVENSKIVDDLAATKDFYLIKIHNSRNSKIVVFWRGCEKYSLFPIIFALIFCKNVLRLHSYSNVPCPPLQVLFSILDIC